MDRNFGWTRAANIGTRTAQGEYLFLVPAGVEVAADTVSKLAARLDADSTLMAVAPLETGANGEVRSRGYRLPTAADFSARLAKGDWPDALEPSGADLAVEQPGGAPLLIRRQSIVQINYFDTRFGQFGADLDLYHQIRRAGKRILVLADVPVVVNGSRHPELAHGFDAADLAHGAAEYLGKWHGFLAGVTFRLGAAVRFLGGLNLGGVGKVLTGAKLDGN
jgi:GT2 family glycosyltransferase